MTDVTRVNPEDRASLFEISTHTYKTIDNSPILTDVRIPKRLVQEGFAKDTGVRKVPVMIHLHGGGLVTGSRDFLPWISVWRLELALKHNAIIVSPDHRLLPEATAEDVLDDLNDFWTWLAHDLDGAIQGTGVGNAISPDFSRVVVTGESAGGYLALQLALEHFNPNPNPVSEPRIRAVVSLYPMVDLRSPYWTTDYEKSVSGLPQYPNSVIDEFIASVSKPPKRIVTSDPVDYGSPRMRFIFALIQRGRILEVIGADRDPSPGKRRIHPEDRVIDGRILPPTLILQGSEDSVVSPAGTKNFVEHLRKHKAVQGLEEGRKEEEVLKLVVQPGEHGFDTDLHIKDRKWLEESVAFVEKHWLG